MLLIITSMSVLRGHFKQSISAFRLGAVTSLLAAIIQWPAIIGNMETMSWAELWWWDGEDKVRTCFPEQYSHVFPCKQSRTRNVATDIRNNRVVLHLSLIRFSCFCYCCLYPSLLKKNSALLSTAASLSTTPTKLIRASIAVTRALGWWARS